MALRWPFKVKATTTTTGTGSYQVTEPTAANYRTLTRAVTDGDLADGDEVLYIVTDSTIVDGPKLFELGRGTWNNTTKVLTRDVVYQPGGVAVSWGAGTRDIFIIDIPLLHLLVTGGTMTGALNILLSGSIITPAAETALLVQRSSVAATEVGASLIAGVSGKSKLNLGDTADEDAGGVWYDHATDTLYFRTNGTDRQRINSSGALLDASGNPVLIPVGTKMLFVQAAAPTGWVQDTSQNDRVLRVVSGVGAGVGGSWTISGLTVGNTTLTVNQIPEHAHDIVYGIAVGGVSGADFLNPIQHPLGTGASSGTTELEGGGGAHTHTLSSSGAWRPAYQDCLVCTKS